MALRSADRSGLAIGAWGAVQATCAGTAIAAGGVIRDLVTRLGGGGAFGPGMTHPAAGYTAVFHLEILLLFLTLVALGPLVAPASARTRATDGRQRFGLVQFPG
jgi:MFS transporter, BCD family, chlorophyll transporter